MSLDRTTSLEAATQHVLDYLKQLHTENHGFFYSVHSATENPNDGIIFWADASSRLNYTYFGDSVTFDTTYRTNQYRVPFAAFTGLNHHGQPVLFGCALIFNESDSSLAWLFQTWLQAMSGRHPVSFTIEPDQFIQVAISHNFPETRIRFSKWGIFRETREKLTNVYQSHPAFETEFRKCIYESETVIEFERCWASLVGRYYLMDNEWLQSIYNARQQWIPAFMRDTFFGELSENEESEILNAFFNGFVDSSTSIQNLIKQYEKAAVYWHEKQLKADYDTTNSMPILKTPSPMEKQAANLYTRRVFMKFQEELVETLANPATKIDDSGSIATFRVAKFEEDLRGHTVTFDPLDVKSNCSCQMFEYSGIICRHILSVFRAKNVLMLPSRYILNRWTREAKIGVESGEVDFSNNAEDSSTVRYNNLRQEVLKYVEEGAKSVQSYHVAMDGLDEAVKKVDSVKNKSKGAPLVSNGNVLGMQQTQESGTATRESLDEKARLIQQLEVQLEKANHRCEVYRANLLGILRDMEEQKMQFSVKVQNARLSMKE